jgi:glutamine synthetase
MTAALTFETLKQQVASGAVDTVLACLIDMQGRLMGKRFHAVHFIDSAWEETHCCNYLLATDLEMATPDGYQSTSWEMGYGDYVMKPDLATLRPVPWLDATVMVICDILDHHTHEPVPHAPREILKRQIARLAERGFTAMMATELEFFLFEKSHAEIARGGFRELTPISAYNEDYHILQTSREEHVMRPIRNHLFAAGLPVENTKGEAEAGQEELNIRYADTLSAADHHSIAKHAVKEIAWQNGHAASFIAKWHKDRVGSSSHIHQSLWREGEPVFHDPADPHGMSQLMKHYLAGLLKYSPDITYFLAPYINSYKRFQKGGSDMNPYLAMAGQIAAGLRGIEEKLPLDPPFSGDVYGAESGRIPTTLTAAMTALSGSAMLREAFGDFVVDHYTRAASWEIEEFEQVVTDYEIARNFERA